MSKLLYALLLITAQLFSLELSINSAKEANQNYSILHIKDKEPFLCQEIKNEFEVVTKSVCTFVKIPRGAIAPVSSEFFEITSGIEKNSLTITIKPKKRSKLIPIIFNLTKDETIFNPKIKRSNHWTIIGFNDAMPFIKEQKRSSKAINFPLAIGSGKLPFVGSLDFNGNPINIKRVGDVKEYIKIKKLYEEGSYDQALRMIDVITAEYPDSLFNGELLYYKIRVSAKLNQHTDVIESSKKYLIDHSGDENVAEVLSLLAKSYAHEGQSADAEYFYDRLFSEHMDSVYAQWGRIYMARELEKAGSFKKARDLYLQVINESKDIDVALEAALRLSANLTAAQNTKEASKYANKILVANQDIFAKNPSESTTIMNTLADMKDFNTSAKIASALLKDMPKESEAYEEVLKKSGVWLSKTEDKKTALVYLDRYLKEFKEGKYIKEVKEAKDALFFDIDDANKTKSISEYDALASEYKHDAIGQRALYEKAKLLLKNHKYKEVLAMEKELLSITEHKDIQAMLQEAKVQRVQESLDSGDCTTMMGLFVKYPLVVKKEWEDGVYECSMKAAAYTLAKKVTDKNVKSSDLNQRAKWLFNLLKIEFAQGNYKVVLAIANELKTLNPKDKNTLLYHRYLFDTYYRLRNNEKMIEEIVAIEKIFGQEFKDMPRYTAVMAIGSQKSDNNIILTYGEKINSLQSKTKSYTQTPFVEFTLHEAYLAKNENKKAYEVIKSLENRTLSANDRSRQKYLLGNVLSRLWKNDEAKKAYQEAINADKNSAWAKLAATAKKVE